MLEAYEDIKSRISEEPIWYDQNGVPRYEPFNVRMLPNIYATYAVYYEISCQACGRRFRVAECWQKHRFVRLGRKVHVEHVPAPTVDEMKTLHFGDPPRHDLPDGNRCSGETMNCDDLRVLEFWRRDGGAYEWRRDPTLEVSLADGEASKDGGSDVAR